MTDRPTTKVTNLADVSPERVSYLWPGRLPLGKTVILDGDPSVGKSTLSLDLAARVSTGAVWPDGAANGRPADVLLLSAEDGLGDTIRPRLDAAGADVRRIHALEEVAVVVDEKVKLLPASLPRDVPVIERLIRQHQIKLVIVDVLMAFLSGKVDAHRDQDVRGALHQLSAMAERTGCTLLLIRHLNKAGGSNPMYRGGGSIGIIGAARAAFLVARDPDDPERRVLAVTKSNLSAEPPSLAYRLVDDPVNGCARLEWESGPVQHTAATLLRDGGDEHERTERDEAVDWLVGHLTDNGGEAAKKDVLKAARAEGIAPRTLDRAAQKASVKSVRRGFQGGTVWELSFTPLAAGGNEPGVNGATVHDLQQRREQPPSNHQSRQHSGAGGNGVNGSPEPPEERQAAPQLVPGSYPGGKVRWDGEEGA